MASAADRLREAGDRRASDAKAIRRIAKCSEKQAIAVIIHLEKAGRLDYGLAELIRKANEEAARHG